MSAAARPPCPGAGSGHSSSWRGSFLAPGAASRKMALRDYPGASLCRVSVEPSQRDLLRRRAERLVLGRRPPPGSGCLLFWGRGGFWGRAGGRHLRHSTAWIGNQRRDQQFKDTYEQSAWSIFHVDVAESIFLWTRETAIQPRVEPRAVPCAAPREGIPRWYTQQPPLVSPAGSSW